MPCPASALMISAARALCPYTPRSGTYHCMVMLPKVTCWSNFDRQSDTQSLQHGTATDASVPGWKTRAGMHLHVLTLRESLHS